MKNLIIITILSIVSIFASDNYKCFITHKEVISNEGFIRNIDHVKKTVSTTFNDGTFTILRGNVFKIIADQTKSKSIKSVKKQCKSYGVRYKNGYCSVEFTHANVLNMLSKDKQFNALYDDVKSMLDTIPKDSIGWRFLGDYDNEEIVYVNNEGFTRFYPNMTKGDISKSIQFTELITNNSITLEGKNAGLLVMSPATIKIDKRTMQLRFTIDALSFLGFFDYNGVCEID